MNRANVPHLKDEQIIQSLEEKIDLSLEDRKHLATCSRCRIERKNLEENLIRLGEMAVRSAPSLQRRIMLPSEHPAKTYQRLWGWRKITALGVTAGFALLFFGLVFLHKSQERTLAKFNEEMLSDEHFMNEIVRMGKSDLPQTWLDISGELDVTIDEEMFEFITPSS